MFSVFTPIRALVTLYRPDHLVLTMSHTPVQHFHVLQALRDLPFCFCRQLQLGGMFQRSSSGRRSTKGAVLHDGAETQEERKAKSERENQQLLVYLFVCVMLLVAWLLGSCGASFFWVFFLIALTFAVWWNKVMGLLDRHLREQELVLHRRRALRQSETSEWLNFIINRWSVVIMWHV